jgi:hypothetical protein
MIWRCLDSLTVLAVFAVVYVIPPLLALRRLYPSAERAFLIVVSAGLGLSSQALIGFFWNHFAGHSASVEACTYYLLWLSISIVVLCRKQSSSILPAAHCPLNTPLPLLSLILLAAVLLRSFDALDHASLGQSDAYTHLQFLRDVIGQGLLRNIVYPPGYTWVLALPTMTFNLDAYMVARYAGAFFGALMVATLYLLGSRHNQTAGLLAALLAAVCPLLYPLIKTGMGAFANQLGLFLLPLALLAALMERRILFTFLLLGLTVTVPLFVFPAALILFGYQRSRCWDVKLLRNESSISATQQPNSTTTGRAQYWWREPLYLLLPFLLALAIAGYHFLSPGKRHVTTTASLVTGIQTPANRSTDAPGPQPGVVQTLMRHPAGKMAIDLLTLKRAGLGSPLMNATLLSLAGLFGAFLVMGRRSGILTLIGLWGLLTTLQVGTGLLEFSLYQRSGWILLQAIALAGGVVMSAIIDFERTEKLMRPLVGIGLLGCLILALWFPPRHRTITSGAENELATALRELSSARVLALNAKSTLSFDRPQASPLLLRAAAAPKLAVITRRYTLFNGDQGNMADALPDPAARIFHIPVEKDSKLVPPTDQFLCLIDRFTGLPDMGLLDRISPSLTRSLADYQPLLYKPNDVILAFLDSLPKESWRITREDRGKNLIVLFVERLSP